MPELKSPQTVQRRKLSREWGDSEIPGRPLGKTDSGRGSLAPRIGSGGHQVTAGISGGRTAPRPAPGLGGARGSRQARVCAGAAARRGVPGRREAACPRPARPATRPHHARAPAPRARPRPSGREETDLAVRAPASRAEGLGRARAHAGRRAQARARSGGAGWARRVTWTARPNGSAPHAGTRGHTRARRGPAGMRRGVAGGGSAFGQVSPASRLRQDGGAVGSSLTPSEGEGGGVRGG